MQIHKQGSLPLSVLTKCLFTSTEKNLQESSFSKYISESRFLIAIALLVYTEYQQLVQQKKASYNSLKRIKTCTPCKLFVLSNLELSERLVTSQTMQFKSSSVSNVTKESRKASSSHNKLKINAFSIFLLWRLKRQIGGYRRKIKTLWKTNPYFAQYLLIPQARLCFSKPNKIHKYNKNLTSY